MIRHHCITTSSSCSLFHCFSPALSSQLLLRITTALSTGLHHCIATALSSSCLLCLSSASFSSPLLYSTTALFSKLLLCITAFSIIGLSPLHHGPVLFSAALCLLGLVPITVSLHLHGVVLCIASGYDSIAAPPWPRPLISFGSGCPPPLDAPARRVGTRPAFSTPGIPARNRRRRFPR